MDPEDQAYVCTLDEYSLEKAKRELFEDPKQRLGAVQTLRKWIRAQQHLISRDDTDFLLRVLRTAKFSQLRAREILETILTCKTKHPDYMTKIDTHEPGILAFTGTGGVIVLPKIDKEGQTIFITRMGLADVKNPLMTVVNELRMHMAIQELAKEKNEALIVNGALVVCDLSSITMKHITRYSLETTKIAAKVYLECNPGRIKGFHFYNGGPLMDVFLAIIKPLLKKKFTDRLHVHDTMESLYKVIPMELWPEEYLPDDYKGPSAGTVEDIADNLKNRLMEPGFRARLLDYTSERYKSNTNKKDNAVPQESFRKLNLD
jgi:hypothetical protein